MFFMKPTLGLLALCIVVIPDGSATMSDQEFVIQVNNRRRAFAKQHKLANMNELSWSQELSDAVPEYIENGESDGPEKKKQLFPLFYEDGLSDVDDFIPLILDHLVKGTEIDLENQEDELTFLSPTHNMIGCGLALLPWARSDDTKNTHCLLAPGAMKELEGMDMLQEILSVKGEPGSKCQDGYENNDGLCSLIPTTTTEMHTTTEEVTTTTTQEPETSSEIPTTEAPPTEAPSTEAPPTEAPSTDAPSTEAPSTEASLTKASAQRSSAQ